MQIQTQKRQSKSLFLKHWEVEFIHVIKKTVDDIEKMQWNITIHLSEWSKSKILSTNAGEDVEQQGHSHVAGGNTEQSSHFGR